VNNKKGPVEVKNQSKKTTKAGQANKNEEKPLKIKQIKIKPKKKKVKEPTPPSVKLTFVYIYSIFWGKGGEVLRNVGYL